MSKVKFLILFIIIFFYFQSGYSEILNISVQPENWTAEEFPTIFYEVSSDTAYCEYIIDNILNNSPDGEWSSIEELSGTFNLPFPLNTGEYEFWMRTVDAEGNRSKASLIKIYIDKTPPPKPPGVKVVKEKNRYYIRWGETIDRGSGVEYYEVKIGEEEPKLTKIKELEVSLTPGKTYKINVRAVDKAGNKGEFSTITYYLPLKQTSPGRGLEIMENWTISGYRSLVYRDSKYLKGNISATEGTTTGSSIEQSMVLNLRGLLPGGLEANATVEDIPSAEQNILIELKKQDRFGIKFGNLQLNLSGGEFTTLATKTTTGAELFYQIKNLSIRAITSRTKSLSRTEVRQGANIKGPYQIYPWIVEGSEQVKITDTDPAHKWLRVDPNTGELVQVTLSDTVMIRDVDYVIDYISGEITFTNIVWNTATITVTFEYTLPFSGGTGDLFGSHLKLFLKNPSNLDLVYLQETANQSGALNTASVENRPLYAPNTSAERIKEYVLDNWPVVERTETVRVNQQLVFNELDYPGQLGGQYFMDYDRGVLRFKDNIQENWEAPYRNEEIKVSYNYYISFHSEEQLSEEKKDPLNSRRYNFTNIFTSYPNPKRVRVWLDKNTPSEKLLIPVDEKNPAGDYKIDPKLTYIEFSSEFINSIENFSGERITVEYREVPGEAGDISRIKRNVWGINTSFRVSRFIQIESEFATSESDRGVYGTPAPLEELEVNQESPEGPYRLSHTPLIPGKEIIKVNGIVRTRYLDYYIDYNKGEFYFIQKVFSPRPGDKIEVEYRYLKQGEATQGISIIRGNAFKIRSTANLRKLQLEGSYRYVEPEYLPVGANRPAPENKNIFLRAGYIPNRIFSLNTSFSHIEKPAEITEMTIPSQQIITNTNISSGFTLSPFNFPKINFNYQTSKQKDNLKKEHPKKQPDTEGETYSFNISHSIGKLKSGRDKIITNLNYSRSYSTSLLGGSKSERETETKMMKLGLNPVEYVTLDSEFSLNRQSSTSITPTSKTTTSDETGINKVSLSLTPANLYRITGSYDIQRIKRSQERKKFEITTIEAGFALLKPLEIKRSKKQPLSITTFTLNYSYREDPSSTPGGVTTQTASSYIAANLTKKLIQTFSVNFNSSRSANRIGSESINYNIGYTYNPSSKKISRINLNQIFSNTKNYSLINQSLTTSITKGYTTNFGANLAPFKNFTSNIITSFQRQKTATATTSNFNLSLTNSYKFRGRMSLTNSYFFQKTGGTTESTRHNLTAGVAYNFSANSYVSLDTNFVDFKDKKAKNNYATVSWILKVMLNF